MDDTQALDISSDENYWSSGDENASIASDDSLYEKPVKEPRKEGEGENDDTNSEDSVEAALEKELILVNDESEGGSEEDDEGEEDDESEGGSEDDEDDEGEEDDFEGGSSPVASGSGVHHAPLPPMPRGPVASGSGVHHAPLPPMPRGPEPEEAVPRVQHSPPAFGKLPPGISVAGAGVVMPSIAGLAVNPQSGTAQEVAAVFAARREAEKAEREKGKVKKEKAPAITVDPQVIKEKLQGLNIVAIAPEVPATISELVQKTVNENTAQYEIRKRLVLLFAERGKLPLAEALNYANCLCMIAYYGVTYDEPFTHELYQRFTALVQ